MSLRIFVLLLGLLTLAETSNAQSVAYLPCVSNTSCTAANALEGHSWGASVPSVVIVGGYAAPNDGGGGEFVNVSGKSCPDVTPITANTSTGSNNVTITGSTSGLAPGFLVIDTSGYILPGTEIASVSGSSITITQLAIGTGGTTITARGNNGGTQIQDANQSLRCWYKTNYRGEPHEWGAVGDSSTDDTAAIEAWLGAYGVPSSNASATAVNFGPWIATIPANYSVQRGLACPYYANLQGTANISAAPPNGTPMPPPVRPAVRIFAGGQLRDTSTALLTATAYCRISGIAIDAQYQTNASGTNIDAVDVAGTHVGIDNHALIEKGYYNINCPGGFATKVDGLQIKDSQIFSSTDNGINIPGGCANTRVIGDLIQNNGQDGGGSGVYFKGSDISIESGIVEGSGGAGIFLDSANNAVVSGMKLNGNGGQSTVGSEYPGMEIRSSNDVSVAANVFSINGGDPPNGLGAHVLFAGNSDDINFSGNSYSPKFNGDGSAIPAYAFDVGSGLSGLTNLHIYDQPEQPAVSVFSPAAQPILASLMVPQFTQNQIGGLILSNDGASPNTVIDVTPGSAADSSNSTIIQETQGCSVNMATNGIGGIDTGTGSGAAPNTTYFIYAIAAAAPGGTLAPAGCVASTSPVAPRFDVNFSSGSGYLIAGSGGTTTGTNIVYNATPLTGARVGNAIQTTDGVIPLGTTIAAFSANAVPAVQPHGSWSGAGVCPGTPTVITLTSTGGLNLGQSVVDVTSSTNLAPTVITAISGSQITVPACSTASPTNDQLFITGARQVNFSGAPAGTSEYVAAPDLIIGIGYYRLLGAVYTDSSANLVHFTQEGDTFYLANAVTNTYTISAVPASITLGAVPSGIKVKAFGRCVGGASGGGTQYVIMYSPGQRSLTVPAKPFPLVPGFDVNTLSSTTAFPFSAWTDTAQSLQAVAGGAATLECMTDGWEWHRS